MCIFYYAELYNKPEWWIVKEIQICEHDLFDYAAIDDTYFQMLYLSLYCLICFDLHLFQIDT
jgi:hypothetical protein